MMKEENEFVKDVSGAGFHESPRPIEPGGRPEEAYGAPPSRKLQKNHAVLVLALGTISLFMCGPLGVAAWALGTSDLRKIRRGEMSPEKIGILRFGRSLGITGTIIFVLSIALAAFLSHRGVTSFGDILGTEPLTPQNIVYAGEWLGRRGTYIRIRPDGSADFRSRHSSMVGGRVRIQDDSLSIGIMGLTSTWHIDEPPHLEDGHWTMKLDGETFTRKADGHLVHTFPSLVVQNR